MPEEEISPGRILLDAGAQKAISAPTFLQKTGLLLAASVGLLGAVVILALVFGWMHSAPAPPLIPAGADANTVKQILENYKSAQQIVLEPYTTLLDSIVVKILLPVFTSILGYIFGSRSNGKET